ncbi:hypothetical protein Tco_0476029 [Tanacetum coccineum]
MSSITAQQTKLDLELVPKEKRLEIRKCNGRLKYLDKKTEKPPFKLSWMILLSLRAIPYLSPLHMFLKFTCTNSGLLSTITDVVVDQMHQSWRTFSTIINRSLSRKTTSLDKLRLSRAQILWGMYYKKNVDYVELLWEDFTYQIDNRGVTPPKKARKFKNHASPKLTTVQFHLKNPQGIEKRKGIDLLSEMALTEEAQYEEVSKKSLRDFHKTHPSGSGIVTKIAPSAAKIKPSVINKGTGAKPGVPDVTEEESTESEAESWGRDKDDSNNDHDSRSEGNDQESSSGDDNTQSDNKKGMDSDDETNENEMGSESYQEENEEEVEDDEEEKDDEFVKTSSNSTDDEDETNKESKVEDKTEGDEDKEMDFSTNQFADDVDVRLNEPVNTDDGFIQKEGTDAEMVNVQQRNENPKITLNQVIEDAHVTISTVTKKTEVPITSSSHSSDLASKFLNFSNIPHTDAEIVSPMDVHVHHKIPSNQTPTLLTVPVSVITESSPIYTTVIL